MHSNILRLRFNIQKVINVWRYPPKRRKKRKAGANFRANEHAAWDLYKSA